VHTAAECFRECPRLWKADSGFQNDSSEKAKGEGTVATEAQIEANRRNAQLSTGPRSINGKARVAANALKHRLTAKTIVLPNEEPDEFEAFRNALCDDLDPEGAMEELLVQKIVADAWRIMRTLKLYGTVHEREKLVRMAEEIRNELSSCYKEPEPYYSTNIYYDPPQEVDPKHREKHQKARAELDEVNLELEKPTLNVTRVMEKYADGFDRLRRHEEALSRSLFRTYHELERLQAKRRGERVAAPAIVDVDVNIRQEEQNPEAILQNKAN
jgi:hypothetical protein